MLEKQDTKLHINCYKSSKTGSKNSCGLKGYGLPIADLMQGNIGMTRCKKFDPEKGFRLLLTRWIKAAIQEFVLEAGHKNWYDSKSKIIF